MKIEIETKYNIGDTVYSPITCSMEIGKITILEIRIILIDEISPQIWYLDRYGNKYYENELFPNLLSAKIVKIENYKKELEKHNPI